MKSSKMTKAELLKTVQTKNEQIQELNAANAAEGSVHDTLSSLYQSVGLPSGSASIGLIITDTDGTIISFNKAVQDLFGFQIEEYENTNVADLYANPQDRQRLLNALKTSKAVRDFEVQIKHHDGTMRSVLANVDYAELNHKPLLLTSLYDITQYKQNLNEVDKNYRRLFSSVPVGITVTDVAGNIIITNNAMKELLGYEDDDILNQNVRNFYYVPSDREELLRLTKKLGNVRDFETKFRHKNGSVITVLINTDRIAFSGENNMLLTSIRDITHLKRIEDELMRERDFSNAILDTAASLIVVLDQKGVITRFNRSCERISGYKAEEIIGTYVWETQFFDPMLSRGQIDKLLSDAYPHVYETTVVSKTGERHNVSWTFAAMRSQEGHLRFIIATGIDVTKRQRAENDLQEANRKLAVRVNDLQERTKEMKHLNELGEQLQSCQTIDEACAVSVQYIRRICPGNHGALYLLNADRDLAEAVGTWSEPIHTKKAFEPLSCWAIRRGRKHLVDALHPGLLCGHIDGHENGQYLCVPLMVNGEAIGILHLNNTDAQLPEDDETAISYMEHKTQLVTTIAEHIALAISNLNLRETLRQQSIRDALTGLYNRRYMQETLERELVRAQRENTPVGLVMFDIDHFKNFNDRAGHDAGDALLRELGTYLNTFTRGGDIVCRYGGEEFLAVLPGATVESAAQRAEQIRRDVSGMVVYHLGKPLEKCTISLGVSVFPANGNTGETLLKAADNALYRAKNEGRNRVVVAE